MRYLKGPWAYYSRQTLSIQPHKQEATPIGVAFFCVMFCFIFFEIQVFIKKSSSTLRVGAIYEIRVWRHVLFK